MRGHLLQASSCVPRAGNPHAAHQLGLADVDRGNPGDDLFLVLGFGQHGLHHLLTKRTANCWTAARGEHRGNGIQSSFLARETMKGPWRDPQRPAHRRSQRTKDVRRRQATTRTFSNRNGRLARDTVAHGRDNRRGRDPNLTARRPADGLGASSGKSACTMPALHNMRFSPRREDPPMPALTPNT